MKKLLARKVVTQPTFARFNAKIPAELSDQINQLKSRLHKTEYQFDFDELIARQLRKAVRQIEKELASVQDHTAPQEPSSPLSILSQ